MIDKNLKSYYDPLFDEIFYSKEFIDFIIENKGYCPSGLTFDTRFDEEEDEMYFSCCCKEYGYDYNPHDRVIGDYSLITPNVDLESYAVLCYKYLKKNYKELFDEISKYDVYF